MLRDPWVEVQELIRAQLQLQVELSLERHHRFMRKHGLAECRRVVDVGTGNGLFLEGVARQNPGIDFTGIDDKPHMIAEARSSRNPGLHWIQADALGDPTREALATADGVLMRYFVLHMPDTSATIPRILETVRPGTRLWTFDLDVDECVCEPEDEAYTAFGNLVRTFCRKNSVDIRTGSTLPPVLERAGFRVEEVAVEPFDNREIEPRVFAEYVLREAALYQYFLEGTPRSETVDRLEHFLSGGTAHYVRYGMVMISATKVR